MKLIFLLIVGAIFYAISRNYFVNDYHNIKITPDHRQHLQGKLEDHEAGLLVALMAKVAKADGQVCELEAQLLSHTFSDIASSFHESDKIRDELKSIYSKEKESFDNTIDICQKYLRLTKRNYSERVKTLEYLLNLAFIDADFSKTEYMIAEDIANAIEIKRADFEAMVAKFEHFYASQKADKTKSIDEAYKTLGVSKDDDMKTIKNAYRKLVKEHHPDIVRGKGGSEDIIEQATRKLQEINEAYEMIQSDKK
jgi:DnaJ like chaperone protein